MAYTVSGKPDPQALCYLLDSVFRYLMEKEPVDAELDTTDQNLAVVLPVLDEAVIQEQIAVEDVISLPTAV